MSNCAGRV